MQLSSANLIITLLPTLVTGYTVGGFSRFGQRPVVIRTGACAGGPCGSSFSNTDDRRKDFVNRAFEELEAEVQQGNARRRSRRRRRFAEEMASSPQNEAAMRQQQEWINRALGLATDVAAASMSPKES